jgi:hypothetical protein
VAEEAAHSIKYIDADFTRIIVDSEIVAVFRREEDPAVIRRVLMDFYDERAKKIENSPLGIY